MLWCWRGFSAATIIPRDVGLSDSCTPDCCCFCSLRLKYVPPWYAFLFCYDVAVGYFCINDDRAFYARKYLNPFFPPFSRLSCVKKIDTFYRATARTVSALIFPKKDLGVANGVGVYVQAPFVKITFFKVDLKCLPLGQSLSRIVYRFSWAIRIRCRKQHFEIRKLLVFTRTWIMPKSVQI